MYIEKLTVLTSVTDARGARLPTSCWEKTSVTVFDQKGKGIELNTSPETFHALRLIGLVDAVYE